MKAKSRMFTVLLTAAFCFCSGLSFADGETTPKTRKEKLEAAKDRVLIKGLVSGAIGGVTLGVSGHVLKLSGPVQAVIQASNALYSLGVITESGHLQDMGFRLLIAAASTGVASSQFVSSKVMPGIPLIGPQITAAGEFGKGITTIAFYKLAEKGYEMFRDETELGKFLVQVSGD